jgi:redox-sensitive bicupin YhaK (pirin superfamily)
MGFCTLKVLNEDKVIAGGSFARHPHCDMEIFSYVPNGTLEHKVSMDNGSIKL